MASEPYCLILMSVNYRKENVLRLWKFLLELLRARRTLLELSFQIPRIFQEMLYILDWMDEIKVRLLSEDFGKHLMGVEDLLQVFTLMRNYSLKFVRTTCKLL